MAAREQFILENVRGSFVNIIKPNADDKYGMQVLVDKDSANLKIIVDAQKKVFIDAYGVDEWNRKGKYGRYNLPLRDGDADQKGGGEPKDGDQYRDVYFFNAYSMRPPGIVNQYNQGATPADISEFGYSGAIFHLELAFYSFAKSKGEKGGKPGIAAGLQNVMLTSASNRKHAVKVAQGVFEKFAVAEKNNKSDDDFDEFDDDIGF